jgi:phosphoribosylaminoimidazole-succinocarboxamide synthase
MEVILETPLPDILYRGKVRDTFDLGDDLLLMVATDRISAFDVVLPNGIPDKGYILAKLSKFWFSQIRHIVPNHFVALADDHPSLGSLAEHPLIQSLPVNVARQSMVIRRAERIDVECIVRGYLAGSAWAEYQKSGTLFGAPMPAGLQEGDRLPEALFTPTTKAETGHDMPMSIEEVSNLTGSEVSSQLQEISFQIYQFAHAYALERGIIIADTKMEFGFIDGELTLIDELLTPDSSRFWDLTGYEPGHSQPNFDKQFVRDWLTSDGWDREPPAPTLPDDVVRRTTERYKIALQRLLNEEN